MKYLLFFILFLNVAFGFDSIEVLNSHITIGKTGYFKTNEKLSPQKALEKKTMPLPQKAVSFGFDNQSYWYVFTVSTDAKSTEQYYLDVRSSSIDNYEFYAFKNNVLLKSELSGSFIPGSKYPHKESPARFTLLDTNDSVTYLLKIDTKAPRLSAFAFGTLNEIDEIWHVQSFIFAFTTGITLFVAFFSLVFYINTKDKIYFFYMLYIFGLYGSVVITSGHAKPLFQLLPAADSFLVSIFLQAQLIGLTYFSERLLNTQSKIPKLARFIRILLYINIVLSLAFPISPLFKALSFIMTVALFAALLYAALKLLTREYKITLYYFIATGAALLLMIAFTLMHQGIIPYGVVSSNFLTLALIWDTTFLALALGYKITLMQHENIEKERILTLKSRQETLGELTGNVTHQWRGPLSQIGAIVSLMHAKLLYSELDKKENVDYLSRVSKILKHLSNTVETFQSFLVSNDQQEYFNVSKSFEEILHWIKPSFHTENIKLIYSCEPKCFIYGSQNEILQAVLIILQNSKEAIIESHAHNGYISVSLNTNPSSMILTIKDNGGGIKLIPISKIFDPYVSTKKNGTGIGLALAKTIIEKRHQGVLSVTNVDNGAQFSIILPIDPKYHNENE
jgi:signal transduction histidine kinase